MHRSPVRDRALVGRHIGSWRKQQRLELRVIQSVRQRPGQTGAARPAQIVAHRCLAQLQASPDHPLRQMVLPSQPQNLAYLPHRHSLTRHIDSLLLSNGSTLPSVEDCQRQPYATVISGMIRITGIDDRDRPERATPGTRVQHDRGFNRQNGGELPPLRWRVSQQGLTLHNLPGVLPLLQFKAGVFADEELKSANKACEDALGQALLADSADREIFTGFWQEATFLFETAENRKDTSQGLVSLWRTLRRSHI